MPALNYMKNKTASNNGFTMIELLVVIVIIAIMASIAIFGVQGARESGRDAKRKADLANIQSALELFRSDCTDYPAPTAGNQVSSPVQGDGSPASCNNANVYMAQVPTDPVSGQIYRYRRTGASNTIYYLCAKLEQAPNPLPDVTNCGGNCGSGACNYIVQSP